MKVFLVKMRLTTGQLAAKIGEGWKNYKKIYRQSTRKWEKVVSKANETKPNQAIEQTIVRDSSENAEKKTGNDYRKNEMQIQMLSAELYEQVFRNCVPETSKKDAIQR